MGLVKTYFSPWTNYPPIIYLIPFGKYNTLGGYPAFPSCDFINIISGGELCPYCCANMHAIFKHHLDGIRNLDCNIIT